MIDKSIRPDYVMQGKVRNYLGKQKMVKAPVKWKSGLNKPETELAYITKAEKDAEKTDISDENKYLLDQKIEVLKSITLN